MTAIEPGSLSPRPDPWWPGAPRAARAAALVAAAALMWGTIAHLVQLVLGRFDPYPWAPHWLASYYVWLTIIDPLAAILLLRGQRAGLVLGCAVLVSDAVANFYATYLLRAGSGDVDLNRAGQAVVSLIAVALLAAAPRLWRAGR